MWVLFGRKDLRRNRSTALRRSWIDSSYRVARVDRAYFRGAVTSLPKGRQRPACQRWSWACSIGQRSAGEVLIVIPGRTKGFFLMFRCRTAFARLLRERFFPAPLSASTMTEAETIPAR